MFCMCVCVVVKRMLFMCCGDKNAVYVLWSQECCVCVVVTIMLCVCCGEKNVV